MTELINQFKQIMRQVAATVTVVTVKHEGTIHGMTATAFTSVSIDPLLVLVCIKKGSTTHQLVTAANSYAVNILQHDQVKIGERFAGIGQVPAERFQGIAHKAAPSGNPWLLNTIGRIDCKVWQTVDAGDHTVFFGQVEAIELENSKEDPVTADTLLYQNRQWQRTRPVEAVIQ